MLWRKRFAPGTWLLCTKQSDSVGIIFIVISLEQHSAVTLLLLNIFLTPSQTVLAHSYWFIHANVHSNYFQSTWFNRTGYPTHNLTASNRVCLNKSIQTTKKYSLVYHIFQLRPNNFPEKWTKIFKIFHNISGHTRLISTNVFCYLFLYFSYC